MKNKKIVFLIVIALSILTLVACTKDSKKDQESASETGENQQVEDNLNKDDDTGKTALPDGESDEKANENVSESNTPNSITKVKGRKEFLTRLDDIQEELDTLPEKKDSDAGATNAMRSFYGKSYDMYDEALNDIYALLKKQLSSETMKNLKTEQIKWIEQKEALADQEASQYKGGTFEFVAYHSSLYQSTKDRCYELVNKYMTE
ncbi:lysozyme inhibitor LprI family protein [Irregularibacter muris]|uniref:Lysozyme inhibitor LprI family protein n=1 Tax=Irregularibacter muris TaxID=1796619 RepID=A0AAE3HH82_9FIRM|nr:lysozyme inhibitor LprI family protein [Irregularibacter muris]MCR1898523.1 lysozyme inhibitor LprI family protein [Irregularibacter muris]